VTQIRALVQFLLVAITVINVAVIAGMVFLAACLSFNRHCATAKNVLAMLYLDAFNFAGNFAVKL